MASYRRTAKEDRAKAIAGVLVVHVALGAIILTGLNVSMGVMPARCPGPELAAGSRARLVCCCV